MTYRPRTAPARFFNGAPEIVRRSILVMHKITPAAPLDFDVLFKPIIAEIRREVALFPEEIVGLDFGKSGAQGCHFFLEPHEARAYRERNRSKRVAWADLPEPTQRAILSYLES